jgi:glutamine amidotransferase
MRLVAIVDYGLCNLDSVARAVEECGGTPIVTHEARDIERATHIILPGVGSFKEGMANLRKLSLEPLLGELVARRETPFLGICLGMQMLATKGLEGGEAEGLCWIEGEVRRLEPKFREERLPHMGWNEVVFMKDSPIFKNIESGRDFYFAHSYHFWCRREEDVLAKTDYCGGFVSAVGRGCVFGVQFHPEKSQRLGFQVIKNFLAL